MSASAQLPRRQRRLTTSRQLLAMLSPRMPRLRKTSGDKLLARNGIISNRRSPVIDVNGDTPRKSRGKASAAGKKSADSTPSKFLRMRQTVSLDPANADSVTSTTLVAGGSTNKNSTVVQNGPDLSALEAAIDQVVAADASSSTTTTRGRTAHRLPPPPPLSTSVTSTPVRALSHQQSRSVAATPKSTAKHRHQLKQRGVSAERGTTTATSTRSQMAPLHMDQLRDSVNTANDRIPRTLNDLLEQYRQQFPRWMVYLCAEFNLLLYGFGSKRELLDEFCKEQLAGNNYSHIVVCGFNCGVTVRQILVSLVDNLQMETPNSQQLSQLPPVELAQLIRDRLADNPDAYSDTVMVVHNIDGPNLRDDASQTALSIVATAPNVRLVATIDHVTAAAMWDQKKLARYHWVWLDTTTYRSYEKELCHTDNSRMLGLSGKMPAGCHTTESLESVWASLTQNARLIVVQVAKVCCLQNPEGLSFWQLYRNCRDEFLVSSETALRQQLVEFHDHHLICTRVRPDGSETVLMTVDARIVGPFLRQKGFKGVKWTLATEEDDTLEDVTDSEDTITEA